jgi:hypothetical protein
MNLHGGNVACGFFHFTGGGANSQGLSPAPALLPHRPGNKSQDKISQKENSKHMIDNPALDLD